MIAAENLEQAGGTEDLPVAITGMGGSRVFGLDPPEWILCFPWVFPSRPPKRISSKKDRPVSEGGEDF